MIFVDESHRLIEQSELSFRQALEEVVGEARRHAPVSVSRGAKLNSGDVQGGLRAGIHAEPIQRSGDELRSRVGSSARHAAQREFGGWIYPKRRPRLAWRNPVTGRLVVLPKGRGVFQRPGGPRQGYKPFLRPAGDQFPQFMEEALRRNAVRA